MGYGKSEKSLSKNPVSYTRNKGKEITFASVWSWEACRALGN